MKQKMTYKEFRERRKHNDILNKAIVEDVYRQLYGADSLNGMNQDNLSDEWFVVVHHVSNRLTEKCLKMGDIFISELGFSFLADFVQDMVEELKDGRIVREFKRLQSEARPREMQQADDMDTWIEILKGLDYYTSKILP